MPINYSVQVVLLWIIGTSFFAVFIVEQDLQLEREKLYQAIGYSKDGKAADYPKEVSTSHN